MFLNVWRRAFAACALPWVAVPPEALALKQWLFGVIGGTMAGFHVLAIFIACVPFRRREPWAWLALTAGLLGWFSIDSWVSIASGALHNLALIKLAALAGMGAPLVATWRVFRDARSRVG